VLGKVTGLCAPHSIYVALAQKEGERLSAYRALFNYQLCRHLTDDIRTHVNQNLVLGNVSFKQQVLV